MADLGEFSLQNKFHLAGETGIISVKGDETGPDEILDVMQVHLVNTDLFAGVRIPRSQFADGKFVGRVFNFPCRRSTNKRFVIQEIWTSAWT